MRVLLVADVDPLRVIGGGERLLAGHAEGLSARGHEVLVASGAMGAAGERSGIRVLPVGRSPTTLLRAASVVRGLRPNVVLGYQPATALGALRQARRMGVPALYVFSSCWAEEYASRRRRPRWTGVMLRRGLEGACLRATDRVVVLSSYSARKVRAIHPGAAVRLVPGGVDPSRFAPDGSRRAARARLGLPAEGPLLVTVRNLVPRMGLDNLLAAMPAVVKEVPWTRLVVAGDGPLLPALEAQARRLGLKDRVLFAGFVPEASLPDHYRAADLAIVPTRDLEGFGLVTVEALACGTPVAGTPVGATPEILSGLDPALVLEAATPGAMAAGIVRLLRRPAADFPERARRYVLERYTWDAVSAGLERVIEEAVEEVAR